MRKVLFSLIGFGCLIMLLVVGWVAARLTGAMQYYTTPSPANFPTFRLHENFFTSNLVHPKRLDFIAYHCPSSEYPTTIYFHRLCGLPGDTLEIKAGSLFVNGKNLDAGLHLMSHYTMARADIAQLPAGLAADTAGTMQAVQHDSLPRLGLADADVARLHLPARRVVLPAYYPDYLMQQYNHKPWNQDNFGPVRIPAGSYFVLGDNRHNALDSRYFGVISQASVVGTVLGKH